MKKDVRWIFLVTLGALALLLSGAIYQHNTRAVSLEIVSSSWSDLGSGPQPLRRWRWTESQAQNILAAWEIDVQSIPQNGLRSIGGWFDLRVVQQNGVSGSAASMSTMAAFVRAKTVSNRN